MKPVTRWRQWFVGPVPVAVTTVRLVGVARYLNLRTHSPGHPVLNMQLRTPSPHRNPLELRSHRPRPIILVSLQGRLPNLHRLRSPAIHNDSWMLRTTPNWLEDSQSSSVISLQITQTGRLTWCLTLFGSGWLGLYPRKEFSLKGFEVGCSQTTKAVLSIWAANRLWL